MNAFVYIASQATLAFAAIAGADSPDSAGPIPRTMHFERVYWGDVTMIGYFTDAQVIDPAWEAWRVAHVLRGLPKRRIVRREVRWFGVTGGTGKPCARIVYTTQNLGAGGQSASVTNDSELIRLKVLARDPMKPIPIGCEWKEVKDVDRDNGDR